MSKYELEQTEFIDQDHLVAALKESGYPKVEVHEEAQHLRGYHGDTRPEVAHIIVRRHFIGRVSNDIGFVRGQDGKYTAIISEFDQGRHNASWMAGLKQNYHESHAIAQAKRKGYRFVGKEQLQDGRRQLLFTAR